MIRVRLIIHLSSMGKEVLKLKRTSMMKKMEALTSKVHMLPVASAEKHMRKGTMTAE